MLWSSMKTMEWERSRQESSQWTLKSAELEEVEETSLIFGLNKWENLVSVTEVST